MTVDTLDRETVEGKVGHYQGVISNYKRKYSCSYEDFKKNNSSAPLTPEIEDDLLDWQEALLMLDVYERLLNWVG